MKSRNVIMSFLPKRATLKSNFWFVFLIGVWLAAPMVSRASLSLGNAYLELNLNGNGTSYYNVDSANGSTLLTINQGQSLYLGGQIRSYPSEFGTIVTMYYSLNGGSFQSLSLPYSNSGSGYDQWDSGASVNIASLLTYASSGYSDTLTIYFQGVNGGDTAYYSNFGHNFTFTITPVPEPITLALPIFGGLLGGFALTRNLWRKRTSA